MDEKEGKILLVKDGVRKHLLGIDYNIAIADNLSDEYM